MGQKGVWDFTGLTDWAISFFRNPIDQFLQCNRLTNHLRDIKMTAPVVYTGWGLNAGAEESLKDVDL